MYSWTNEERMQALRSFYVGEITKLIIIIFSETRAYNTAKCDTRGKQSKLLKKRAYNSDNSAGRTGLTYTHT